MLMTMAMAMMITTTAMMIVDYNVPQLLTKKGIIVKRERSLTRLRGHLDSNKTQKLTESKKLTKTKKLTEAYMILTMRKVKARDCICMQEEVRTRIILQERMVKIKATKRVLEEIIAIPQYRPAESINAQEAGNGGKSGSHGDDGDNGRSSALQIYDKNECRMKQ